MYLLSKYLEKIACVTLLDYDDHFSMSTEEENTVNNCK